MASRLVDELCYPVLRVAVLLDQLVQTLRFFNSVEVLALDVLDQRDFSSRRIVDLTDQSRDRVKSRPLRGPPATLASDDLETVSTWPKQNGLEDAALHN